MNKRTALSKAQIQTNKLKLINQALEKEKVVAKEQNKEELPWLTNGTF